MCNPASFPLEEISPVIAELQEEGVGVPIHSPLSSAVWPVHKPKGKWWLNVDHQGLSANTAALTAAVPNIAKLIATIQEWACSILETIDVKDMFFVVPLLEADKNYFAFIWEGNQYPFTPLPQGYQHPPTLAHHALA